MFHWNDEERKEFYLLIVIVYRARVVSIITSQVSLAIQITRYIATNLSLNNSLKVDLKGYCFLDFKL